MMPITGVPYSQSLHGSAACLPAYERGRNQAQIIVPYTEIPMLCYDPRLWAQTIDCFTKFEGFLGLLSPKNRL